MKIEHDILIMDDSTAYKAYGGVVGLGRLDVDDQTIFAGFDGIPMNQDDSADDYELTLDHRKEVADFMIEQWKKFREGLNDLD